MNAATASQSMRGVQPGCARKAFSSEANINSLPNFAQYSGLMPSRSRMSVSVRSRRSHNAMANMPIIRLSVGSMPLAAFMRHNCVPAPHTIYQGVHKLEPGAMLTLPWQGEPQIARYWDARAVARDGMRHPLEGSDAELTDQLETLLQDAVGRRMIADVPLGAFLSGGINSSTVVALMQAARSGKVPTSRSASISRATTRRRKRPRWRGTLRPITPSLR